MQTALRTVSPSSSRVTLRGLSVNVLVWEPPPDSPSSDLTVLMLHGFADAAATFDLVAPHLARAGHRVVAPDLRGFGDSEPAPAGSYYHFPDYLADVTALIRMLAPARLAVVGHSMGGTIAVQVAGVHPERLERLVILEGLGPPEEPMEAIPERYACWLADLESTAARPSHRSLGLMADAIERLHANHRGVSLEVLATRAPLLVRARDDGRLVWKYDPLHRTTSPVPFLLEAFKAFLARITCPTLVVGGGETGFHTIDEADRIGALKDVRTRDLDGAGHMMHWTQPDALGAMLVEFLAGRS